MSAALRPADLHTPLRPTDPDSPDALYIRSFLWLRLFTGIIAVALPLVVILVDRFVFNEGPFPRDTVSGYYYSGVRDLFVGMMCATGIFLIAYKISPFSWENVATISAGVAALFIAIFPTAREDNTLPLPPLQRLVGEKAVWFVHIGASVVFLVALTAISILFGVREYGRVRLQGQRVGPHLWGWFHFVCAGVMLLALLWIVATYFADWPKDSVLGGEWATAWAFGFSWFWKGAEIDMLRKRPRPSAAVPQPSAAPG